MSFLKNKTKKRENFSLQSPNHLSIGIQDFQVRSGTSPGSDEKELFKEHLQTILTNSGNAGSQTAVILFSIDLYESLKETLSPDGESRLNKALIHRLKGCLIDLDISSPSRGEGQFSFIYPAVKSISELRDNLQQIQSLLELPFVTSGKILTLHGSMGVSLYPGRSSSTSSLIRQAEMARSIASRQGGNRYIIYSRDLKEGQYRPFLIDRNLPDARDRNELSLKYQPRINCKGEIVSVESLLRWNHPEIGTISPDEFIPLAESSGEIIPLGEWALREACRQAREWMDRGIDLIVSVNISPVQIHQLNADMLIREILDKTGLPPARLELEVTETTKLNSEAGTIRSLRSLHDLGIRISLDDFGTGFSSLSYLGRFPVDVLKIDQSFVKDIESNHNHRSVVQAIMSLARSFRYKLIAEGVETEEQLQILKEMGCHEFQGFYYHQPLSAQELEDIYAVSAAAT